MRTTRDIGTFPATPEDITVLDLGDFTKWYFLLCWTLENWQFLAFYFCRVRTFSLIVRSESIALHMKHVNLQNASRMKFTKTWTRYTCHQCRHQDKNAHKKKIRKTKHASGLHLVIAIHEMVTVFPRSTVHHLLSLLHICLEIVCLRPSTALPAFTVLWSHDWLAGLRKAMFTKTGELSY